MTYIEVPFWEGVLFDFDGDSATNVFRPCFCPFTRLE